MTVLFSIILPLHSQTPRQFSIELKDKPLPAALKLIEKEGGKNIIFSYNETESYRVTASIRQKTELEAIGTVLNGTPFICKEREEYFVIQKKGKNVPTTEIRGQVTNEKNEPLPYSNVLLLTPGDSTFVNGCVTREDGSFLMIAEEGRPYLIRVSYIGYKTEVQPYHPTPTFHLLPDTQLMQEDVYKRQTVGYVFRLLQQCLVCTITLIHFRTGGFGEAVDVLLFHIQMLQTVETPVTHGGIEPSATGVFLQLVELLPGLFHGFAYYVLGFFRIVHQGGGKTDEAWVHL